MKPGLTERVHLEVLHISAAAAHVHVGRGTRERVAVAVRHLRHVRVHAKVVSPAKGGAVATGAVLTVLPVSCRCPVCLLVEAVQNVLVPIDVVAQAPIPRRLGVGGKPPPVLQGDEGQGRALPRAGLRNRTTRLPVWSGDRI